MSISGEYKFSKNKGPKTSSVNRLVDGKVEKVQKNYPYIFYMSKTDGSYLDKNEENFKKEYLKESAESVFIYVVFE